MIRVAIAGASGYSGRELIKILLRHPQVTITALFRGKDSEAALISTLFPELRNRIELICEPMDQAKMAKAADLIFLALPHTESMAHVPFLLAKGKRVIDLGADFRLKEESLYPLYYKHTHSCPKFLSKAVYGLPEWNHSVLKKASLIANPGCYPTAVILGAAPIVKAGLLGKSQLLVDAKSGASGAGRSLKTNLLFCEVNETVSAYKVGVHQHQPEMQQELSSLGKKGIDVVFTPHLVPMDRGILATLYITLKKGVSSKEVSKAYQHAYKDALFVRLCPQGVFPSTKDVMYTNYCDIGFWHDPRRNLLIVVSVIDNLVKGAAGQAVQNMNIMMEWDEALGLL